MKTLKTFLVGFAIILSTANYANTSFDDEGNRSSISYQIERMLSDSGLIIEEDFTVTVFFKITEENRIEIRSIQSPNEEVNNFLEERLAHRKVHGEKWETQKIYELPVKVHGTR